MSGKKKGKGWLMGVIVLILLGILLFLGLKGKGRLTGGTDSQEKSRSYQTEKSKSYQKDQHDHQMCIRDRSFTIPV